MRTVRLALGAAFLALLSCTAAETGPAGPGRTGGRTSVFLTDAPFPFGAVTRVDIHVVSIALALRADTSDAGLPWITVATPDRAFNLLDLQNGATSLLGGADVPPGDYMAVRLIFDPARSSITDAAGRTIVTTMTPGTPGIDWQSKGANPSLYAQIEEPVSIDQNGEDIVIDFDVGRSFLYDGNGGFTFVPALRAIVRSGSGGVSGRVRRADDGTPIVNAGISIHMAFDTSDVLGPLLASGRSDASGGFTALFLRPGSYQVVAQDQARQVESTVRRFEVKAGKITDVGDLAF